MELEADVAAGPEEDLNPNPNPDMEDDASPDMEEDPNPNPNMDEEADMDEAPDPNPNFENEPALPPCPELLHLSLEQCNVGAQAVVRLLRRLPALQDLELRHFQGQDGAFENAVVRALPRHCPKLRVSRLCLEHAC